MFDREVITENGKATFYATIWPSLMEVAADNGWALGLHGSLQSDMDIMAMPWTKDAKPVGELIGVINELIGYDSCKEINLKPYYGKPNNRVVYTIRIFSDWYLDINVIESKEVNNGLRSCIKG